MMGADLYLTKIYEANRTSVEPQFKEATAIRDSFPRDSLEYNQAQIEVEHWFDKMSSVGYYIDPYTSDSLLAQLGLSWWQDVLPLLNENDELSLKDAKWFLSEIRNRRIECQRMVTVEQELASSVMSSVARSVATSRVESPYEADEVQFFVERKLQLIRFLSQAIETRQAIVCSL